ncbi:MAG TPA: phosphotransferase family protein [Acidimicrobiales bacterium]|nr:phosphotransferase family protein [Acidimicrobiales bacterium]
MDHTEQARLVDWLDRAGVMTGPSIEVDAIATGRSNITYVVGDSRHRVVVRRPATVALDRADEGMRREFRLLSALDGTPVPHPSPIALCDDSEVLGCVFYVMSYVDGFLPTEPLPNEWATPESRRAMSFSAVDAMAALHAVDWRAQGLEDLGRIDGFHTRQRTRWLTQYYSYPSQLLSGIDDVGVWLEAHPPTEWTATIMHGDVNGNNLLVAREHPPVVAALLDWETATIGDPLLDVAGFKRTWTERRSGDGWPSADELLAHYAEQSGRRLDDLTYYDVLYRFKFAVLTEGIYQRSLSDHTRSTATDLHEFARDMIDSARRLAGI